MFEPVPSSSQPCQLRMRRGTSLVGGGGSGGGWGGPGRVQVLLRGALEDPAIPIVPGAVARAVPGAVGVVPVDGASHVLAPGGQSRERAVLGLVHCDPT